ncbi:unnamed protein product [Spirodela intermedia]|uniref:WRKY domain-containing protein n=1 Tax=Spirodela intermedia TaxID=51605 RepID=A0A7I8JNU4_SPIIN|nr:unnamed protein product [Spirodela intermedia]CAA6671826.1 unnamed protein product [Spirodela intermedia]
MCSYFSERVGGEQGDLADIVRASGCGKALGQTHQVIPIEWQLSMETINFSPSMESSADDRSNTICDFVGTTFFDGPETAGGVVKVGMGNDEGAATAMQRALSGGNDIRRPGDDFSRVLQMSPSEIKPQLLVADRMKANGGSRSCPLTRKDHGFHHLKFLAPRKGQKPLSKKVVCIAAPPAGGGRPGGEVVPSDLWAWRKYGQKPIKGSPYPRGYYRCSSSKGCSARKQVERSRTDPNMLVITYTSDHNHPWPTQRNSLAGSTRSRPTKNGSSATKSSPSDRNPPLPEGDEETVDNTEKRELNLVFEPNCKVLMNSSSQPDDFFADLSELDASDPLGLAFASKALIGVERENKDSLAIFDWVANSSTETKKRGP